MTYEQIASMIESIGLPFTYYQFAEKEVPAPPFIVFWYPGNADDFADNVNYGRVVELNIELYSDNKDFTQEAAVERILTAAGLAFEKSETYIDSERMYEVLYETEVALTNED